MDAHWLDSLNAQQKAAATFGEGPLLIIAGAGTGKTNTLAHRVAHLISTGVAPARLLLLPSPRRAAGEMLRRVQSILALASAQESSRIAANASRLWGGTFHSVANRIL